MFCSKCGQQSTTPNQQFCANCGSAYASISGATQQQNWGGQPQQTWGASATQNNFSQGSFPKTNSLAIIGFILSLTFCLSFVGMVLSIVGLIQINKDPMNQKGKGLAVAGIVIGAIGFVLAVIYNFASILSEDYYY